MEKIKNAYLNVCNHLDWKVNVYRDDVELEKYSPAGGDFILSVTLKDFKDDILDYYFDEDEHVRTWLNSKNNGVPGVPSAKELVKDAEDITIMIDKLKKELSKV